MNIPEKYWETLEPKIFSAMCNSERQNFSAFCVGANIYELKLYTLAAETINMIIGTSDTTSSLVYFSFLKMKRSE